MIVPKHFENLRILHENTMPNRSYYIPVAGRMDQLVEHREVSDRMQLLSGEWKFRYYSSIYDLKEEFFAQDYSAERYDMVKVPGMWQTYGYDHHQYTNHSYPFPFDPPFVPHENPCGAYIHEFSYEQDVDAPRAYLNFEGVDSCFYVWMNGTYVGYSQVSHSTSEFDVTDHLKNGVNKLAVLVLKWCDGSYMEDQDKFRMSGIFRDVYLLKRPRQCVFDYYVTTALQADQAIVDIRIKPLKEMIPVQITVYDREDRVVGTAIAEAACSEGIAEAEYPLLASLVLKSPKLWTAETPYLYTLILETNKEIITDRIGVREINIEQNVVKVNGVAIKFRGVNRHDSDPVTGYAVSLDQMKRDLHMMKRHNFNAIRTSHYPNVPYFYQLCDQYGFYVIDEADHENQGPCDQYFSDTSWENISRHWNEPLANNPDYTEATLDRTQRLVYRDKNRPCVVIWSMGNESAYGCTFEDALKWTKEFDPTRLTHYESALYTDKKRKYDYSNLDLFSRMYPSLKEMREYADNEPDKPFILCEYCHSMGNGPGDFEDYFEVIESDPLFCGAFVWEWCDHAIYKGKAENGKAIYFYGGDHGEYPNDNNFCMDGLVYPDRAPHTGLLEYKNVNRPARVADFEQSIGALTLHNYLDFVDLKEYLTVFWEVNCDGEIVASGRVSEEEMISVEPHGEGTLRLDIPVPEKGRCYLKVFYALKCATEILPEGYLLGFDEILLSNLDGRNQEIPEAVGEGGSLTVEEDDRYLTVLGETFTYVYNKFTGLFDRMILDGKPLITRPMEVNIWRAPADNDANIKHEWRRAHYNRTSSRTYETIYTSDGESVRICSRMSLSAVSVQRMMDIDVNWTVFGNGKVRMEMAVVRNMEFPRLPRFGVRLFLPKEMDEVTYYGVGPQESYCDKCRASSHGKYNAFVEQMHEDYLRPQENGSHYDCDYVVLSGNSASIAVTGEKAFSFNASIYTQEELTEKRHSYELVPCGDTVLCIDYAQSGIGSASCGPNLLEKYWLDEEQFNFRIELFPIAKC